MKKYILVSTLIIFSTFAAFSQAGKGIYRFLDLPVSSRIAALGGTNVSLRDNDINFVFTNPALLTSQTDGVIGLNMANYLSDIKFGSAVYGHNFGENNFMSFGVQYVDLGNFDGRDELDVETGTFTAKDMALYISYARPLTEKISVGTTFKPIYSAYERYTSFGIAFDAGVHYNDSLFSAGLVFRNMGTQLKAYRTDENGQNYEAIPFDIQLGVSKKFAHAPFRFSLTMNNLQHWDLTYATDNNTTLQLDGTTAVKKIGFADMAFRHTNFSIEFTPSNSFYLAAGYNHRRHQEMSMSGFKSMAGFSFGGGVKLYKFHVGFGMTQYQVGNYAYMFSVSTALKEFMNL